MNKLYLHSLFNAALGLLAVTFGFYLLTQFLMFVLSLNVKRILTGSGTSAYDFLQKGNSCRGMKKGISSWFMKGPGTTKYRKRLLTLAKNETKDMLLKSNTVLYGQCLNCIFRYNCEQKYQIRCSDCKFFSNCPLIPKRKSRAICDHFKCARWIEKD